MLLFSIVFYLYKLLHFMLVKLSSRMRIIAIILLFILLRFNAFAQVEMDSISQSIVLTGSLVDAKTNNPLTYASVFVVGSTNGVVSNEKGYFEIDITGFPETDTLRFQYIGYKSKSICIADFDLSSVIALYEEIYNLSETVVFGVPPKAKDIVKKILENKDKNYKTVSSSSQVFARDRNNMDLSKISLNCKKSSIEGLDKDFIDIIQRSIPKESVSYTDFLGWVYNNGEEGDSAKTKIDPIRIVSLKEKDIAELDRVEEVFEKVLNETKDDEYWKVKTGILSQKIEIDDGETTSDSTKIVKKDSIPENTTPAKYLKYNIKYRTAFAGLNDKDQWEFLYKTGRYKYALTGGTRVNGEECFIIDFEPSGGGMYVGRMFVSRNSYALIRADYQYAPGKNGRDFNMFGVGYTESQFDGSIYFEKIDSSYVLKYFSVRNGYEVRFDRSVSLLKKKERWLIDKKVNEIKIGIEMSVSSEESYEYLVIDRKDMSSDEFKEFKENKRVEIIYVEQFDDKLWAGYPIIAPTKRMKEYKKQGF